MFPPRGESFEIEWRLWGWPSSEAPRPTFPREELFPFGWTLAAGILVGTEFPEYAYALHHRFLRCSQLSPRDYDHVQENLDDVFRALDGRAWRKSVNRLFRILAHGPTERSDVPRWLVRNRFIGLPLGLDFTLTMPGRAETLRDLIKGEEPADWDRQTTAAAQVVAKHPISGPAEGL
jgi:hypothetical protein